jgi:hypothetical protein
LLVLTHKGKTRTDLVKLSKIALESANLRLPVD